MPPQYGARPGDNTYTPCNGRRIEQADPAAKKLQWYINLAHQEVQEDLSEKASQQKDLTQISRS